MSDGIRSAIKIEIALRAGVVAKASLELLSLEPEFARLQIQEVAKHLRDLDDFIERRLDRTNAQVKL